MSMMQPIHMVWPTESEVKSNLSFTPIHTPITKMPGYLPQFNHNLSHLSADTSVQQLLTSDVPTQRNLDNMYSKRLHDVEDIRSQALAQKQYLSNVKTYVGDVREKLSSAKDMKTREILDRQQMLLREVDNMCRMNVCQVELQEREKAAKINQRIEQLTSWETELTGLINNLDKQINYENKAKFIAN